MGILHSLLGLLIINWPKYFSRKVKERLNLWAIVMLRKKSITPREKNNG